MQTSATTLRYPAGPVIPVFIDAALPEEPTTQALLAACSQMVRPNACELAAADTAVARVLWPNPLRAIVAVTKDTDQDRRIIDFRTADLPTARWQAAGFILGSMLHDAEATTPRLPAAPNASVTPVASSAPSPAPPADPLLDPREQPSHRDAQSRSHPAGDRANQTTSRSRPAKSGSIAERASDVRFESKSTKTNAGGAGPASIELIFGIGGLSGLGLARAAGVAASARLGGWTELELRGWKGLGIIATADRAWLASGVSGVAGNWSALGVGPSLTQRMGHRIAFLFRATLSREQLSLRWSTEQENRSYWGWRVAVGVEGRLTDDLALAGQIALSGSPAQPVRVGGVEVARNPALAPIVFLGIRVHFWRLGVPGF